MQIRVAKREVGGRKLAARRGLFLFPKGIGLFKLAAGLLAIASVLFLVPGLRLLVPGLQDIGTTKSQAMPVKDPQEKVPSEPDTQQPHEALNFGTDELGLISVSVLGDNGSLGLIPATVQPERPSSDVIDVGDQLLDPQVWPHVFGTEELSLGLAGGSRVR
ncbi:MAG: hypothetical protein GWP14_00540 [Actinobacteria bacterium]|nr:hypothetical protein [Actinomycetota bacterium]